MANAKQVSGKLEWRINVPDGTSNVLVPESDQLVNKAWLWLKGLLCGPILIIWRFLYKAWNLGVAEPKKAIHGVKVGLSLLIVSFFYYMRPLYDGVGGNAMWAVMTVVVVFESTVGATLSKCFNRTIGTFLAGSLALGVQWIADKSGETFQPIIIGISVFLLASAATFSRFIPSVKTRFDYGAMIFILTFSLVTVSGYRVDRLFEMAYQRLSTIAIGTSLCIFITMVFCPIWAGSGLHDLIVRNLEKLADSLDGCVSKYFKDDKTKLGNEEDPSKRMQGYKCVLNSKATEEVMANLARWEPAHGRFNFRHPWKQYLKIGTSMRKCAYCIEALNSCINSEIQAPDYLKKHLSDVCMLLSTNSSEVLKELVITMKTLTKSSKIDLLIGEMNLTVQKVQDSLNSLPNSFIGPTVSTLQAPNDANKETISKTAIPPLMEVFPLASLVYLLIEIVARTEGIADAVDQLAGLAEFELAMEENSKQKKPNGNCTSDIQDHETMKTLPKV
ncbi:aluminum-activated malate transporter 10-like [Quercus robur]|uniref:aluminum-activated malate transporter 10-like n=1 Tax=Quercus robur TaxID=38942 RepID=UPI0021627EAE|nr:aluminum-activated malate transporter 10-like [Quercus robur]